MSSEEINQLSCIKFDICVTTIVQIRLECNIVNNSSLSDHKIKNMMKMHILDFCKKHFYGSYSPPASHIVKIINDHYYNTQPFIDIRILNVNRSMESEKIDYSAPYNDEKYKMDNFVINWLKSRKEIEEYLINPSPNKDLKISSDIYDYPICN